MKKALHSSIAFLIFLTIYSVLGVFNLDRLPVAWTDEVLNLDPAVQFIESGTYTSKLWPNKGADVFFASYFPGIQWFQTLYLNVLPITIFWVRLPFLILTIISMIWVYKTLKRNTYITDVTATLIVLIIFLDKSTFELTRSMRVETLIIFGVSMLFYLNRSARSTALKSFIMGYLIMCHAYVWPFLGIWFMALWIPQKTPQKIWNLCLFLLPSFFFLASVNFNISIIWQQMGFHINQHTIGKTDLPHHPIINSVWYRFFPHYLEQPLIPFIFYGIIILILYLVITRKISNIMQSGYIIGWLFSILLLFGIMSPQYRYVPVFWMSGWIILSQLNHINLHAPIAKNLLILMALNLTFSFLGRHGAGYLQQNARNPEAVLDFLRKELEQPNASDDTKTLILGSSVGFYFAHQQELQPSFEYGVDFYPQHFKWSQFQRVILLTHEHRPQDTLIATYRSIPERWNAPSWMMAFAKGGTYDGMRLYQLKP
jgi:hypothetical protein